MTGFLERDLTGFALCWRIERRDGVVIGLTAHDRDLWIDGLRYRSAPSIAPSAIEDEPVLQGDALDVAGALSSEAITADDLRAGRWNGAAVRMLAADWEDTRQFIQITRGELGAVSIERGRFNAELKGPGAALDRPIVESTSPYCRAELGDRRCRVDLAARRRMAQVASAEGDVLMLDAAEPSPGGWGSGRLRWLTGRNSGLTNIVLTSNGAEVTLTEPPAFVPVAGDRVELFEGCDKRFVTCRDRFANAQNFRGEPHLPGVDLLTRYPGE